MPTKKQKMPYPYGLAVATAMWRNIDVGPDYVVVDEDVID